MIPVSIPFSLPCRSRGKARFAQYAGRLHRLHDAKREVIIYDYVDLARMAAKRRVGYQTIGYRILGTGDLFADQSVGSNVSGAASATFSVRAV